MVCDVDFVFLIVMLVSKIGSVIFFDFVSDFVLLVVGWKRRSWLMVVFVVFCFFLFS